MIKLNLKGGMGNQMFQYAFAKFLSTKFNKKIVFNTFYFDNIPLNDTPRIFQLDFFNIKNYSLISKKPGILIKISNKLINENIKSKLYHLLLKLNLNITIDGYFQSEKYFTEISDILKEELQIQKEISIYAEKTLETIENSNSISINIRRGDYTRSDYMKIYGLCSIEYYQKALEYLYLRIEKPIICVFSDDPDWVKENFNFKDVIYAGTDVFKDYEQILLMSKCKHNIIANSTFSWWGAWLNNNKDKIVIAPKQWLTKKTSDELGIIPESWIQI